MGHVVINGGPCDGTSGEFDDSQVGTGTISCGGVIYRLYMLSPGEFVAFLPGAAPPHDVVVPDTADIYEPDSALAAWRHLQNAAGQRLPAHVNRTKTLRKGIRRLGRR